MSETTTPRTEAAIYIYPDRTNSGMVEADFARTLERELSAAIRDRDEAYGKGVSAGKQEALNYTANEREKYGAWAADGEHHLKLKAVRDTALARIAELEKDNQRLSCLAGAANDKYDTVLSVLAGEQVDTDGNEAAQAVRALMLKGGRR